MKIGRSFWTVLAVVIITTTASILIEELLVFRLMVLWVGIFVFAYIWTYLSLHGISLSRYSRDDRIEAGGYLREVYEIQNNSWLWKVWLEVLDKSAIPFSANSRILTRIGRGEKRSFISYTQVYKRGYYQLGPTVIRSGDLLGIFRREMEIESKQSILVTPLILEIDRLDEPAGFLPGGKPYSQKTNEITPFAAGIDEYHPGDPLNKIHWLSTARMNKIMVKEFDYDPLANVFIVLDLAASVQWDAVREIVPKKYWMMDFRTQKEIIPSSMDYLCAIGASLCNYYIHRQYGVGIIARDQGWQLLAAEHGERQLIKVLEALALAEGTGELSLDTVVRLQVHSLPRGSFIWLVTPLFTEEVLTAAEVIRMRGMQVRIAALDGLSFGLEEVRNTVFLPSEADPHIRRIPMAKNVQEITQCLIAGQEAVPSSGSFFQAAK